MHISYITRLCGFARRGAAEAVMISQISLVELRKSIFEIEELEYIESYGAIKQDVMIHHDLHAKIHIFMEWRV